MSNQKVEASENNGLDNEHYIDDLAAQNNNEQIMTNTKILPSVNDDENPFSFKMSKGLDQQDGGSSR